MTPPIVPPSGRNPADSGQREAVRDHLTRLRHDGGTYRSIAAAAALSPGAVHRLASGRRRAQPGTAAAVLTVTSPALPQARLDAGGLSDVRRLRKHAGAEPGVDDLPQTTSEVSVAQGLLTGQFGVPPAGGPDKPEPRTVTAKPPTPSAVRSGVMEIPSEPSTMRAPTVNTIICVALESKELDGRMPAAL